MKKLLREATVEDIKSIPRYLNVVRKHNLRYSKIVLATDADSD